jgi:hypothetical protein
LDFHTTSEALRSIDKSLKQVDQGFSADNQIVKAFDKNIQEVQERIKERRRVLAATQLLIAEDERYLENFQKGKEAELIREKEEYLETRKEIVRQQNIAIAKMEKAEDLMTEDLAERRKKRSGVSVKRCRSSNPELSESTPFESRIYTDFP